MSINVYNGTGVSALMSLAHHYSQIPQAERPYNLLFLITGEHEADGKAGMVKFAKKHPELIDKTKLVIQLEHMASPGVSGEANLLTLTNTENARLLMITNVSPWLVEHMTQAASDYGIVMLQNVFQEYAGDIKGLLDTGIPSIGWIETGYFYHNSADSPDNISAASLQNMTRAYASMRSCGAPGSGHRRDPAAVRSRQPPRRPPVARWHRREAGDHVFFDGRGIKLGDAGLAGHHLRHRLDLDDVLHLPLPLRVGVGDEVAVLIDDRRMSLAAKGDGFLRLAYVSQVEGANGDAVRSVAAGKKDRLLALGAGHDVAEGDPVGAKGGPQTLKQLRPHALADDVRDVQTIGDAAFGIDKTKVTEPQAAGQFSDGRRGLASVRRLGQIVECRRCVQGIAVKGRGNVARQQKMLFRNGG